MRGKLLLLVLLTMPLWGCNDDPIIGPTDDDTSGGGSYGVIHFGTSPEDAPAADALEMENPERF